MRTRIWLALLALYVVWGSTYLAIRFAVETIPPFLMAGLRFMVSGAMLYALRKAAGDPNPTPRQWRSAAVIGLLLLLGGNGLVSWAEQHIASGIAALMVASIPLWIVLLEALRRGGRRPDSRIVLGLLIGFGGIALLISSAYGLGSTARLDIAGLGVLLLAALLWSVGSLYARGAEMPTSSLMGTAMEMLAGSAGLLVAGTVLGEWHALRLSEVSTNSWLGLAYLILFGSLVGFVSYSWLLRNAPISLVSTYAYVNPMVAIFVGAWLGAEVLTSRIILAALIIVGSVVIVNLSRQNRIQNPKEPAAIAAD